MPRLPAIRQYLIYAGAIVLIVLAISFSLLRAALPYASDYRADLEQQLSRQLGLPVSIASLDAGMRWFTPQLVLVDVVVYQSDGKSELIRFDEIELALAWLDSLRYRMPMIGEINLVGSELRIERAQDGLWRFQGVAFSGSDKPLPEALLATLENANYALLDSHLTLRDATGEFGALDLRGVNITVENFLGQHRIQLEVADMAPYADRLKLVVQFNGRLQHAIERTDQIYFEADAADVVALREAFGFELPYHIQGEHDMQLWLELDNKRLRSAAVHWSSRHFSIAPSAQASMSWQSDSLAAKVFWRRRHGDWQLALEDFQFRRAQQGWLTPSRLIVNKRDERFSVSADYLQLRELSQLAGVLLAGHDVPWKAWPQKLQAEGRLYNLFASIDAGDPESLRMQWQGEALAADLGSWLPQQPVRFSGLDAAFDYRDGEGQLVLHADALQLELKKLFRKPLQVTQLAAVVDVQWHEGNWQLRSDHIIAANADLETQSRLLLYPSPQGGVFVDMQTHYRNGNAAAAGNYYPVSIMEPELVSWLDTAIRGGRVTQGDFLLHGDVLQFPFRHNGVLQAGFDVEALDLQYQPGWPALRRLQGRVLFDNTAMHIHLAGGNVYDAGIASAEVSIADMYRPELTVDGRIRASAADLKKFVLASPLRQPLGETMNALQIAGDTVLGLSIALPLEGDAPLQLDGTLTLIDNTVVYPALQYELSNLRGTLRFSRESVQAEALQASVDGHAVQIDIAPLPQDSDTLRLEFRGNLPIDSLLKRFDWVPHHWLNGASDWRIWLDVPIDDSGRALAVQAQSDMRGVSVAISDTLTKPAQSAYPLVLEAAIDAQNLRLALALPQGDSVQAVRDDDEYWRVLARTSLLRGQLDFHQSLSPATRVKMRLDRVELSDLLYSSRPGIGGGIEAAQIPSLEITTKFLRWRQWRFHSSRLRTSSHRLGMVIDALRLQGDDLTITGKGSWLASWIQPHETTLKLQIESTNLGNALASLGYDRVIEQAETTAQLDLKWPAAPYHFSWDKLVGHASFEMFDGEIAELDPGAGGRVVGLLNVFYLPRRLFLSFGDVYQDGFVFDSMTGDFDFANGKAATRNTEIIASAADVRIQGSIGMHEQNYDLLVRVKPKTSAATFTGGALAGGPVVGAALVLLQKILRLDKAAQERYAITGSWQNPVITQIGGAAKAEAGTLQHEMADEVEHDDGQGDEQADSTLQEDELDELDE